MHNAYRRMFRRQIDIQNGILDRRDRFYFALV